MTQRLSPLGEQSLVLNALHVLQLRAVSSSSTTPSSSNSLQMPQQSSSSSWNLLSKAFVLLLAMMSIDFSNRKRLQPAQYQELLNQTTNYFQYNPDALQHLSPIDFQEEWLNDFNIAPHDASRNFPNHTIVESPQSLPVPLYVDVYELSTTSASTPISLQALGREARQRIDQTLHTNSGAMLFRNLHHSIRNASEFATFWNAVVENPDKNWNPMTEHLSCYNRKRQRLVANVDQVDTDVPSFTIGPHNEHSCNPYPSSKIFFYALQPAAQGGESLLRRNRDIVVPPKAKQWVQEAGGLQFARSYPTARALQAEPENRHSTEMSWQERTNTQHHDLAQHYFATQHGINNVTFDPHTDTLTAHSILPGFITTDSSHNNNEPLWFNRIDYGFPVPLANGRTFPLNIQAQLKRQKWHETQALPLQQGDWLVLDNQRVQHGRLPYQDNRDSPPRQLLVTYTT